MSNPLTYLSPGPDHSRTLQIATWIYLLILGILNALLATCLGGSTIALHILISRVGAAPAYRGTGP